MASNFEFLADLWPDVHTDAVRAESYALSDPRSALIYARRVVEQVVGRIFDLERLQLPYTNDLVSKIRDASFKACVGNDVVNAADLIRRAGNSAVHENRAISTDTALTLLTELHFLLRWAAYSYSADPEVVPTDAAFDPGLIPVPAPTGGPPPLTQAELNQLLAAFDAKDAALARERETNATLQAELEEMRAKVKAAQEAKLPAAVAVDHDEANTRSLFIDLDLREAGWEPDAPGVREHRVTGMAGQAGPGGVGYVDYVLWAPNGLPLAIVEAKRSHADPTIGQQQAKLYADCLERDTGQRPVIFWSNGWQHWIWDDAAGYPPRRISGFLTADELGLVIQRRRTRQPLTGVVINKQVVERHYQTRAIRAIGEAFEGKQRGALLVMATGSGKTRTVIALVDQLMRAGWAKRVLFLADRVALVNQAVSAFKTHLPSATTVNLVDEKVPDGRVFVSTYPTMMGLIKPTEGAATRFGPGYFDLIVIDEAHRSVYQKYRAIFEWFDALLVGLTATPKDEVDRNTYGLFGLEDGVPTDAYSLDEAVAEGYLVPPVAVSVPLKFMRQGIHYDQLDDSEKDQWDSLDWGDDASPTDVDPDELNRWLFNTDTVDKVIQTLMTNGHKVAGGDRIGKTIVFAKNQEHARFIQQRFDAQYPELGGTYAQVVTHQTTYAQTIIDSFSDPDKAPHVAISVDMLDTGIDVPEVVNLVFFKRVRSVSKFWQMIGRGTRLRRDLFGPGEDKLNFYVFDFCMNLEYFNQPGAGSEGSVQKSLGQRLFETRVGLVSALDERGLDPDGLRTDTARWLHSVVAGMNLDNVIVRGKREWVQRYGEWSAWASLPTHTAGEVTSHLGGLPSTVRDDDEQAKRFDLVMLTIQLAVLDDDHQTADRLRRGVQAIASNLLAQTAIPAVAAQEELLAEVADDDWWVDVTLPMLELGRKRVRGLVRFLDKAHRATVYTDLADELGESTVVALPGVSVGTNWERFKAKVRAYLAEHDDNISLQRLRRNRQLTLADLIALEDMLVASGAGGPGDVARAREESQGLGLFIRSLVGLDRSAASEAFSEFLTDSRLGVTEIRFIQMIVEHLTANGVMPAARLYEAPFTDFAPQGPDVLFSEDAVDRMVMILDDVRATALPA